MNNDINAPSLSSVAACSSNSTTTTTTTTAPCNAIAGSSGGTAAIGALNANDSSITSVTSMASNSTTTISTASPSIYTSANAAPDQTTITANDEDKPNKSESWGEESRLKDWDYCRFKQLLDEAYSYKNPRDKENKSEFFLQLLQKAEKEKEDQKFAFRALTSLYTPRTSTSNSQKQGGSLQDLVEAVRNDSLDCDYNYGGQRNRRHNHNSRPKKYSSVSSRQREGGSLPSNVNVSNCSLSVYEQPFLNEESAKQSHDKNEPRTNTISAAACQGAVGALSAKNTISAPGTAAISSGCAAEVTIATKACLQTSKNDFAIVGGCGGACEGAKGVKVIKNALSLAATIGSATSATCAALATATAVVSGSTDTVVEMNENYIDQNNEMLTQGIQFDRFDGIEMKIPRANMIGSVLTRSDFSPNNTTCYVDEAVHFTTLERGKSTVDASYIPLDENYKACKSVLGEKSELVKMQSFSATKTISKQYDENGNSLNTTFTVNQSQAKAKKKKTQSERNTKTLDVQSVEGYRGSDPIEELVKYIESSEDTKQNEKVNKFADSKKKDKKRDKEKDKEKGKIKRSNSLEELRSCSKMDGDDVTMRNKTNIKNKNVDIKDKQIVSSVVGGNTGTNRKGERRSWGTEELTYLGENNAIEEVREKVKDKEKKKSKEKDVSEKLEKVVEKRKKNESNLVVSMESISCESAEFHVVTKKKKPKKQRQMTDENRNNNSSNPHKNPMYQNRKYHSNFSNDRDAYMGSFSNNSNNDKSRRKSTSSMPPSEKSDSSDLDSVHSLPIESAGGRSPLQVHHHQNQPRSYAEIARKTDAAAAAAVVCPTTGGVIDSTASNTSSNNSSHTELEVNAIVVPVVVNTATKKSKKSIKADFPELISNEIVGTTSSTTPNISTIVKQISYSQSLTSAGKNEELAAENVLQVSPPTDTIKTTEYKIQKQPQHQMPLQKSKSVETDSFYNSIDQYPALEKTVKRHSTANACGSDVGGVTPTTPPSGTVCLQTNTNSITSSTIIGNSTPSSNKKSKTNTKVSDEVLVEQQHSTTKKSKKDKSSTTEHYSSITQSTTTSSSSSTTSSSNIINNKNQINHNHHNYNLNNNNNKSSCSNSHNNNNNSSNNSNSNNKYSNRPAVIILNDDTTAGGLSSCIGNEFTFGDFNEEELRLFDDSQPSSQLSSDVFQKRYSATTINSTTPQNFDDSGGNFNTTGGSIASDMTNNSDDALILMQHTSSPNSSLVIDQSSDSGICNNYGATKGKRINQQSTGTIVTTNRSLSTDALINNTVYLSASTSPSKESLSSSASSSSSTSSNSSASSGTYVLNAPVSKSITLSTGKTSKSKTASLSSPNYNQPKHNLDRSKNKASANNSLCNTKVSTMNKRNSQRQQEQSSRSTNCNATTLPSLETCDDIETAIIAAAKKAAAVAAEQTSTSVINKNYTTKGINNLSAMGSTTTTTTTINNINSSNKSNLNHLNSCNSQPGVTSPPLSVFNQKKEYSRRGGGNSSVGCGTAVLGQQQRKEIDVHFIQPLATPISSIQNNVTIINFIGSAWEEVANSKVTQFYDGQ